MGGEHVTHGQRKERKEAGYIHPGSEIDTMNALLCEVVYIVFRDVADLTRLGQEDYMIGEDSTQRPKCALESTSRLAFFLFF